MTWELISTAALERFKIDDLLTSGFEPFAVDNGRVWFRRVKAVPVTSLDRAFPSRAAKLHPTP
jgi:hypothetical protein